MRHIVQYSTAERLYELSVEKDGREPILPNKIWEDDEGQIHIWSELSVAGHKIFRSLMEFSHHFKCEIISWGSDIGD